MPKVDELARLLAAATNQDWPTARAIGAQIADHEEELGHHSAAQLLRSALVSSAVSRVYDNASRSSMNLGDPGFLAAALTRLSATVALSEVVMRDGQRRELTGIVTEWRYQQQLAAAGVQRRTKLLLHGPPGCGKSLTAQALGGELGIPVFVVRVDAVIGSFLGQTALRIRELFRFAQETACVLLLDEIDALAKSRGNQMDVGELDRVVIALMQELEHSAPRGIIVGTSNLAAHLDPALYRRFDCVVEFTKPTIRELRAFAFKKINEEKLHARSSLVTSGAHSYAAVVQKVQALKRDQILKAIVGRTR